MIRVTVELIPHGDEARKSTIGTMTIANDGTGSIDSGNYKYTIATAPFGPYSWPDQSGEVRNHSRAGNVWNLIRAALMRANGL